jgi:predicted enzyme related to lactoylglutathione lyase
LGVKPLASNAVGNPVVHFEINSGAALRLQEFYADAFGWSIHRSDLDGYGDVATEGVCPGSGEPGIDGGIGPSDDGNDFVTFYVQVPDVDEALQRVEALGGRTVLPPTKAGRVLLAMFTDPQGNRIGLVRAQPLAPDEPEHG